jgi:hypothetical protein
MPSYGVPSSWDYLPPQLRPEPLREDSGKLVKKSHGGIPEVDVTLKERLQLLVRSAPPGTLVPVEGLAKLIDAVEEEGGDLAVEVVGRLAAERFGRKSVYTPAAVRKWIRSGLRGVRLRAYPSGSGYRVRRRAFEQFVSAVRDQRVDGGEPNLPVDLVSDPELEDEISLGQRAYAASSR